MTALGPSSLPAPSKRKSRSTAQQGIAASPVLYATLLDETHQGALVVDEQCRVLYANTAISVMFPGQELTLGALLGDGMSPLREMLLRARGEQARITTDFCIAVRMDASHDEDHVYRVVAAPLAGDKGAWCIVDDITAQVFAEQIRKDFVTNASHELRTPLSLIHGYIETLQSGIIKGGPSMQRCLEVMEKHSKRMMRIIEDMLTISRLESRDTQLKMEIFHVRSCVEDVLEHLTPLIELRQPKVTIDLPTDGGLLHGDRFYWDQIFTHLIENALKENRCTGLNLRISGEWTEDECLLTVTDNGVGIPAEDLPFVFKRFYRCGKDRAQETKGTGLGLSIVKRAVEAHGGSIELSSVPGVTTSFVMHVPLIGSPTASSALQNHQASGPAVNAFPLAAVRQLSPLSVS